MSMRNFFIELSRRKSSTRENEKDFLNELGNYSDTLTLRCFFTDCRETVATATGYTGRRPGDRPIAIDHAASASEWRACRVAAPSKWHRAIGPRIIAHVSYSRCSRRFISQRRERRMNYRKSNYRQFYR